MLAQVRTHCLKSKIFDDNRKNSVEYAIYSTTSLYTLKANESLGEVAEWSKAAVLKTVGGATLPGVRIPPSPPNQFFLRLRF